MVRTRTNSGTLFVVPWKYYFRYCDGHEVTVTSSDVRFTDTYETITDHVHEKKRTVAGYTAFKPVSHIKRQTTLNSAGDLVYPLPNVDCPKYPSRVKEYVHSPGGIAGLYRNFGRLTDLASILYNWRKLPEGVLANGFANRWFKARPSMASRAGLAVFLYELRDIKRMLEVLPGKHFSLRDWREVLHYANGQHLNYNFGLKPFCRDVAAAIDGLSTFETRLDSFLREQRTVLRKHERSGESGVELVQDWHGGQSAGWFYRVRREWKHEYASTFIFSYTVPKMPVNEARFRAVLDTLGLNLNLDTIWAVVPWSFVVDWFYSVSPYLKKFGRDWLQPEINLIQACDSVKSTSKVDVDVKWVVDSSHSYEFASAAVQTCTTYIRGVGIPDPFVESQDSLSSDRIRLLISLGLQQVI